MNRADGATRNDAGPPPAPAADTGGRAGTTTAGVEPADILVIGMLAHNEARAIGATLASLSRQTVLDPARWPALGLAGVEVIVVPNGCTDETAAVARQALAGLPPGVVATVQPLAEAGKANAWNRFVHDLSRPDATLLALMDADIEFGAADVLERLVARLGAAPPCSVATDHPVKDYRGKRLTPFNYLSRGVSARNVEQHGGDGGLCGQLYCSRASRLRQVWLPLDLPVEDGFLAAMLGSRGFTAPPGTDPIVAVPGTWHFYEPLTGPTAFVRHEARILVGSIINAWLFALMWDAGERGDAGDYVRRRNAEDPRWVESVCEAHRQASGRWLVPGAFLWWRLAPLRRLPLLKRVARTPIALAAVIASLPAVLRANAILRGAAASRHW